ncbi:MAG: DUF423 domain-containing protein [Planctomycetia bacterium]|nr:DUF423 domain-containing protein [Planctomycetia bacterium]
MMRFCMITGAVLGAVSVAGGAFGAHGLKATLDATGQAANWETAARYCMYHALALLALGLLVGQRSSASWMFPAAAWCFLVGTLIFSGCLAALALSGVKILGAIVPIGGVLLIFGWLFTALAAAATSQNP